MKNNRNPLLVYILTLGVFGILNTEMGVIGILPLIADQYQVSVSTAGLIVSLFALAVAVSGPVLPLLFSGMNRKKVMLLVLGIFIAGNLVSAFTSNFAVLLIARVVPAFFHPVYCSLAFSVAAASVSKEQSSKAVAKVFVGVSAGMVLGVPVSSLIANAASLTYAMLFFAAVTIVAFVATLLFVPSMPVAQRLSYGTQLRVLRRSVTWLSIAGVIFMNGAVFGVYSYLAEYLKTVTNYDWNTISLMLFVYGAANIIGNMIAGKLLAKHPSRTVMSYPIALAAVYIMLFIMGPFSMPVAFLILIWGILGGIGGNLAQYWVVSAAPEAPEFANGIFLTSANLGTTIGASVCGLIISGMSTKYVVIGGILFLLLSIAAIYPRIYMYDRIRRGRARGKT
ncbi:MFS transporter [Paenibacillus arenilitoris]|uniref:MFS transporter n=1 Tax=Paenibacillus arenilitoris TaxID=2772299 RepID=A0A927H9S6_9BACL|nr:MFS transporter [Paenibacillus arenilitoris]MBD2872942.1 MFS transporter [Paenibacillus arenilitoris]